MDLFSLALSPNSGPVWGLIGVVVTALVNAGINRRKLEADTSTATQNAINAGHKQLVDALFQQVKVLSEQVEALRGHSEECERQHREKDEKLRDALHRLALLEHAQNT